MKLATVFGASLAKNRNLMMPLLVVTTAVSSPATFWVETWGGSSPGTGCDAALGAVSDAGVLGVQAASARTNTIGTAAMAMEMMRRRVGMGGAFLSLGASGAVGSRPV